MHTHTNISVWEDFSDRKNTSIEMYCKPLDIILKLSILQAVIHTLDSGTKLLCKMDLNIEIIIKRYTRCSNSKISMIFLFLFSGTTKNNNENVCNSTCDLEEVSSKDNRILPGNVF